MRITITQSGPRRNQRRRIVNVLRATLCCAGLALSCSALADDVLLVVPNAASLSTQDTAKKVLMEGWGHTVTPISASDSQALFDAAVAGADVAYISEEITSSQLDTKLSDARIGVINEEKVFTDEYGFSSSSSSYVSDSIDVVDNTHYITSSFLTGVLVICNSAEPLHTATGTLGASASAIAEQPASSGACLVVIEAGGILYGGGVAAGRRVHLPWGNDSFDINELNANGQTIMERAIDWAADTPPRFVEMASVVGLGGISNSYGLAWGDYNDDGFPDIYITGQDRLYKNDGDGTFSAGPSVSASDRGVHWGDYDNDGDLDIGTTWNLYLSRNNGNGSFSLQSNSSIGISSINNLGDFAWIDYDNDGDIDLWAPNGSSPHAYLYVNGGSGNFTHIHGHDIGLDANFNGENTIVGDYDGDGWMDIIHRSTSSVYLFHNNGDGTFTNSASGAGISLVGNGNGGAYNGAAFGDYDNDGDLDLYGGQHVANKLYRNDGDGTFTDVTAASGTAGGSGVTKSMAWGDYDNDGDLDLFVAQETVAENLFRNNGDGTFTDMAPTYGLDVYGACYGVAWEDADLDGDLDLFIGWSNGASKFYRNNTNNDNYLFVRVVGAGACATNRSAVGVRVELYDAADTTILACREIGTASGLGGSNSMWAHFGGVDPNQSYTVKVHFVTGIESAAVVPANVSTTIGGTVIDQMLTVTEAPVSLVFTDVSSATGFDVSTASSSEGSGLHWGDLDNDGDLDAIITGSVSAKLMINNSAGVSFTSNSISGMSGRQGALLDIDNDGDLDFWYNSEKLYENSGSAFFNNQGNFGFYEPSNNENAIAADVNHDGWCDLVMFSGNNKNWIGFNQADIPIMLDGSDDSSYGLNDYGDYGNGDMASSGDVNNDGYLDFFYNYSNGKLFLSDGDGTYTHSNQGISIVTGNSDKMGTAWGDYDNDGDLDLFVPRYDNGYAGYLWRNDGGAFTDVTTTAGVTSTAGQRSACWGDYDNDGDLDLYVVTHGGAANILYENQSDGTFVVGCSGTAAGGDGHDGVFIDYDNDGDLDIAVTQAGGANTLLRNDLDDDRYLKVRVIGRGVAGTNAAAIGTRVELFDAAGATLLARRDVGVARGFGGTEPMWVHFGGVDPAQPYTVKVHFVLGVESVPVTPANVATTIGGVTIAQMLTVNEGGIRIVRWEEVEPQ